MKFFLFMNVLSLGGLPPFISFIPKWMVIQQMTFNNLLIVMFLMMMTALITLLYYIRMCYSSFMKNYFELSTNLFMNSFKNVYFIHLFMSFVSIFGLFMVKFIYF